MSRCSLWVVALIAQALCAETVLGQEVPPELPRLIIERRGMQTLKAGVPVRQQVTVNPALIKQLAEITRRGDVEGQHDVGTTIPLNLFFDDQAFTGVINLAYGRTSETGVVRGTIRGHPDADFTAVVHAGVLSLRIFTPDASFTVTPAPGTGDGYVVEREAPEDDFTEDDLGISEADTSSARVAPSSGREDGGRIDVLFLYTAAARQYWGGAAKVVVGARQMEEFLNDALENSLPAPEAPLRVRFVAILEVPDGVGRTKLQMRRSATVRRLRDSTQADLVVVLATNTDSPGSAYIYCGNPRSHRERALAYVRASYLTRINTIPHEIGHLLGANHNPGANNSECSLPDSRGHFFNAPNNRGGETPYGTIMSYRSSSNRVRHFSNPAVRFRGVATGTDLRDNARAIRASRIHIANYRFGGNSPAPNNQGPTVSFQQPRVDAELPGRSPVTVSATVSDPDGIATVELTWEGPNRSFSLPCPATHPDWSCTKQQDTYTWVIDAGTGSRNYVVTATDAKGNRTVTPTRTIRLTDRPVERKADIVFVSDADGARQIYLTPASGDSTRQLTRGPGANYAPAWSSDGRYILFISERDGNPELYVMDAEGKNPRRLSSTLSKEEQPAWRPAPPAGQPSPPR